MIVNFLLQDQEHSGLVHNIKTNHVSTNTSAYFSGIEFEGTIGAPLISFMNNQPNMANLTMVYLVGRLVKTVLVIDSNTRKVTSNDTTNIVYQNGTLSKTHVVIVNDKTEVNTTTTEKVKETPNIVGLILLSKLIGFVSNQAQHKVIINLGKGVFDTKLTLDPTFDNDLSDAIRNYFKTKLANYNYTLGTVVFDTTNTPAVLQPTLFEFSTLKTEDSPYGVLLMFIKTNASDSEIGAQTNLKLSVNPIPKGRTATPIISNKVLMKHFVLEGIKEPFRSSLSASSAHPQDDPYIISGSGNLNVDEIQVSTKNLRLQVEEEKLSLKWNVQYDQDYSYGTRHCSRTPPGCTTPSCMGGCWTETEYAKMPVHITANGGTSLTYKLDSDDSYISFSPFEIPVNVQFSPPSESSWQKFVGVVTTSSSDMKSTNKKVGKKLQDGLKSISISMSDISVFAVSNLLFPNKKVINLQTIYLAQDLVLFGDVNEDYKPSRN